ncbi:DUF952 domain-containing protein [Actinoplanes sp. LDG1-06]|uniref:DUF952 domain-containing protein n=1 Tax=Paractinoplanes ovalisporus TaxID=2810368 RepID=A0ABS2AE86_9ACTN|nr:DUF952 domain-containing protein [Actinoplanes ovalisporus]MBM2617554.1 DUF952 domain-containing protein [Actinoplanes ovalisporus]
MILHIVPRAAWEAAQAAGVYEGDTLATQGYIHCSTERQVDGPANFLFHGRDDLLLLVIDESRLPVPITWEQGDPPLPDGSPFPHLYAALPLDAVTAVHEYHPQPDGSFAPPTGL